MGSRSGVAKPRNLSLSNVDASLLHSCLHEHMVPQSVSGLVGVDLVKNLSEVVVADASSSAAVL